MEVAIPVGNLKVAAVGDLEVGTFFYVVGGQYDLAGFGVVVHGPGSQKAYVTFGGDKPFRLKLMGGGGERLKVMALDTHEIVLKFAADQAGDNDQFALGAVVVSGAGAEVIMQKDGQGKDHQILGFRLGEYTINNDGPDGDFISLKRWKLVSRDAHGNDSTLFEIA